MKTIKETVGGSALNSVRCSVGIPVWNSVMNSVRNSAFSSVS